MMNKTDSELIENEKKIIMLKLDIEQLKKEIEVYD